MVDLPSTDSLVRSTPASETGVFKKGFLFIFRFSPFVPLSSLFLNASWRVLSDSFSYLFTPRHATPHHICRHAHSLSPRLASLPLPSLRNLSCLELRDRCSEMEGGCNKRTNQRIRKGVCDMRLILRYCFRLLPRLVRPPLDNTLCYSLFAPSRYNPEFRYSFASCSILVQCLADLTGLRVRFLLRFLLFPAPAHGPLIPFPPSCFSAFSSSKSPELTCALSIDDHRRSRLCCLSTSALRVKSAASAASASARPFLSCLLWLLRNQISARFVPL